MTNTSWFEIAERVIGKETFIFQMTDFSCWVYRVTKRAHWWRKAVAYFTFRSDEEKIQKFNTFCVNESQRQNLKEERRLERLAENKKRRQELAESIKVWDLFKRSRGYDMTFNDFYQVTGVKGKKIYVRPISSEVTSWDAWYTGEEEPIKDAFIWEERAYIISPHGGLKVCDYDWAFKSEWNRSYYFNRMD